MHHIITHAHTHTHMHAHTCSRMPTWVQYMIPKIFYTIEKAWNYYPYTKTGEERIVHCTYHVMHLSTISYHDSFVTTVHIFGNSTIPLSSSFSEYTVSVKVTMYCDVEASPPLSTVLLFAEIPYWDWDHLPRWQWHSWKRKLSLALYSLGPRAANTTGFLLFPSRFMGRVQRCWLWGRLIMLTSQLTSFLVERFGKIW